MTAERSVPRADQDSGSAPDRRGFAQDVVSRMRILNLLRYLQRRSQAGGLNTMFDGRRIRAY